MKELAGEIIELTKSNSKLRYLPLPEDDPIERKPDINKAIQHLNWEPKIELIDGLKEQYEWIKKQL